MEELLIEVSVEDACARDEVTNLTSIDDTLYNIAEDGIVSYEPTWSHTETDCPISYLITRIVDGVERELTDEEKLVVLHDDSNGWM